MRKTSSVAALLLFLLCMAACDNNKNNDSETTAPENALLPTKVVVKHLFSFVQANDEWSQGFDGKKFVDDLLEAAGQEKIKIFDYIYTSANEFIPMNTEEISFALGKGYDTVYVENPNTGDIDMKLVERQFRKNECTKLFFTEEWFLDKSKFKMTKEVLSYGLVREFYRKIDTTIQAVKKILFELNFNNDIVNIKSADVENKELLAQNIKYEFNIDNEAWVGDLNHDRFMSVIIDKIKNGETKPHDFYDTTKVLSLNDIKQDMYLSTDTVLLENSSSPEKPDTIIIENEITPELFGSYIFIEDWYIDRNTYKIIKQVKGIAPVYYFFRDDNEEEIQKKIPFVVWF